MKTIVRKKKVKYSNGRVEAAQLSNASKTRCREPAIFCQNRKIFFLKYYVISRTAFSDYSRDDHWKLIGVTQYRS